MRKVEIGGGGGGVITDTAKRQYELPWICLPIILLLLNKLYVFYI